MRRRLTAAMILLVLATLLLSGVASLAVAGRNIADQTQRELVREAQGLAVSVRNQADTAGAAGATGAGGAGGSRTDPAAALTALLRALAKPLRLDGSAVLGVLPDGRLVQPAPLSLRPVLPAPLTPADLQPRRLLALRTVTGRRGGLVFVAVPYRATLRVRGADRSLVQAVVLTRRPPSALRTAGGWFALSALAILVVAALVAWRLGRRFVAPVMAAQEATSRIAAGDLEARVAEPPGRDPELAGLAASINLMAENLARAKAAERHFLQSVSHDLRTPLTSIRGFAEAIEDGATTDAVAAAGVIASEARRLQRLVADLLALATVEARRFTLAPQDFDLATAAADSTAGFAPSATDLGLDLVFNRPAGPCPVTADPDRVAQVVANLVENALRYATASVHVGVGPVPGGAGLWVLDDGPGIPAADLPQVFGRLYQSRPRPGRPIGSGLGLTIVAELVAAMGGSVRAESPASPAGGTRMVVTLPGPGHSSGSTGYEPPSTASGSVPSTRSSTVA